MTFAAVICDADDPCSVNTAKALVIFGLLASFCSVSRRTQGDHLFTHHALLASGPRASWAHPLPATPFQFPRSRTAMLGKGDRSTLSCPRIGLTVHQEHDRSVTQSTATLEPSSKTIPTLDRTVVAC